MAVQIQWRRDTAANWTANNPTLAQGEPAYETDTNKFKIGNGSTAWNSLAYGGLSGTMVSPTITGAAQEKVTFRGSPFAGQTVYVNNSALHHFTVDSSANGTINIAYDGVTTFNSFLAAGMSMSIIVDVTNGTTPYYVTGLTIDGTAVTLKWNGGTAPTSGNASAIDRYVFQIVKTASATYTVYATQVKFA